MSDFRMPSLGADMEKGTVVEWLKKPGEKIARGDVVAVVETQKGAFEVEIFEDGVLSEILVPVGTEVPVGAVLARIESGEAKPLAKPAPPAPRPAVAPSPTPPPRPSLPSAGERLRLSPAAARRAAELHVDPHSVTGSGQGGAITLADIEAAVARAGRTTGEKGRRGFDPSAMRQAIASAMARSKREIPHYYLSLPIDMSRALQWLAAENARRDVENRLLAGVLLLKATALALKDVPELNGFWIEGGPRLSTGIHVGWAISLRGGGLMAPAIHDADGKSIDQLMAALRDLVVRARTARLRGSEMTDPTVTVTSLGERGAERVYGVIYPPQLAIVGFGAVRPAPAIVDGAVAARPTVYATVSGDHRASDGVSGSRLLAAIDSRLQAPEAL
ncbi:MAG: dihydrolipoamide acetyltransferase family protein [Reyranella sp.]|nr:dihydrolipoamide acetyltransferase family protein [Reyranella sp.]